MDKPPGSDGFSGRFFQTAWSIIKDDVFRAIQHLYSLRAKGMRNLNDALIILLPKKDGVIDVKDFRPISLIHSFGKLFSKMLANRLAPRLSELVAENQSAFVKGRSIHDNFKMVQLTTHTLHLSRVPSMLVKVDITKAFDSVSWSFLLRVLRHLGFGDRFIEWICIILSTASSKLLLKEYLEGPSYTSEASGRATPCPPCVRFRTSMYADDVVILSRLRPASFLRLLLESFGGATGLRTNLDKCSISPIRCSDDHLAAAALHFPCGIKPFPCTYLGLRLSYNRLPRASLQPIIDTICRRLAPRSAAFYTSVGRLVLIKSVITSIPIYLSIAMELPAWLLQFLEKRIRAFFWKGSEAVSGGHCLVAWDQDCRPVEYGGLGVLNLKLLGFALRARWLWLRRMRRGCWTYLPLQVEPEVQDLFDASTRIVLGDGRTTLFWTDPWLNGTPLRASAPALFAVVSSASQHSRTVESTLLNRRWIRDITGPLSVPVLTQFLRLVDALHLIVLAPGTPDRVEWNLACHSPTPCGAVLVAGCGISHASMAGRFLLTHDVSDLCIGKPALRWLPPSSTVAHAVAELDGKGPDACVAVWDGKGTTTVAGRVRMSDVVVFLCADSNLASPAAALQATLADLLAAAGANAPPVRCVQPHVSVLEAVDALLGGAPSLVVPIHNDGRRAPSLAEGETMMCWLTVEHVVRFFLGSVALFSSTASRSVSDLAVVSPALSVGATDDALSAVLPLLRTALATHASIAVVSGGRIQGEISSSTLCSLDPSLAAAAFVALSAGELASFVDCVPMTREAALRVVRSRLGRRNHHGMLDLLDGNDPLSPFSSSSSSSPFSSSSSSEDDDEAAYNTRPTGKHGSWSKGRRAAREPISCRRGSSLVAVMAQAVAHRVTQVWVLGDEEELVGVVGFLDVLRVLRRHLLHTQPAHV
ncbi:hypothetical protein ACQ4PT_027585 [Festuca glaucescens]